MNALLAVIGMLVVLAAWTLILLATGYRRRIVSRRRERVRIQLAQLAAERRIQQATQDAVSRMLRAAREVALRNERP